MIKRILLGLLAVLVLLIGTAAAMNRLAPMTTALFLRDLSRRAGGLEPQTLDVQGKTFPYLKGGHGPALVLVHGFTSNKDTWDAIAPYLTGHYTVYALDLPGFGNATRDPNGDYSYDAQVENLHAFLSGLGLGAVDLGGNSMGGGVVALYAAKYPKEVTSLWLLDAGVTQELADSPLVKNYVATGAFPLLVKTPEAQAQLFDLLFGAPKFLPYSVTYAFLENSKRDFDFHGRILKNFVATNYPIESRFSNLPTPALIVSGEKDRIVPPAAVPTLAKVFPKNVLKIMPGLGHIPMVEDPKQTAADYLAFRATLANAP